MRRITGLFNRIAYDRKGAAVAEYGLLAAIVGAAIAVASLALGSAVTQSIEAQPNPVAATVAPAR